MREKYGITFLHEVIGNPYRIAGGYWWGSSNEFGYLGEQSKGTLKIVVYDLFGNIINTFESLEKCRIFYKCSQTSILNNCNGLTPTLKGMLFRYEGDSYDKYIDIYKEKILQEIMFTQYSVYQYDSNFSLIMIYNSIREAVKYIHNYNEDISIDASLILNCCLGKRNVAGGYLWSFNRDLEKYKINSNSLSNKDVSNGLLVEKKNWELDRPIDVYSLEYDYITTVFTRIEIRKFLGSSRTGEISKCLTDNSKSSSAYGYIWCYHGESPNKDINHVLKIDKYTMDGAFVKTYKNASEAARDNKGIHASSILLCCKGKLHQTGNSIWRYNGHPFNEFPVKSFSNCKPLSCYTKDNVFVNYFVSMKDAAAYIGKKPPTITAQLSGRAKTAGGYCFYYANDPNQPDPTKVTNITAQELFDRQTV